MHVSETFVDVCQAKIGKTNKKKKKAFEENALQCEIRSKV